MRIPLSSGFIRLNSVKFNKNALNKAYLSAPILLNFSNKDMETNNVIQDISFKNS